MKNLSKTSERRARRVTGGVRRYVSPPPPPPRRFRVKFMRRSSLLILLLIGLAAEFASAQQASQTFVSNINQTNGGVGGFHNDHAQAFTTGSSGGGYQLTAIMFQFSVVSDPQLASKMSVSVRGDSSGNPGSTLATLTNPTLSIGGERTFSFTHSGITLAANTTYWAVIDIGGGPLGNNAIRNTASDAEDSGAASGWSIADDSRFRSWQTSGSWQTFVQSKKMSIIGTVTEDRPYVQFRTCDGTVSGNSCSTSWVETGPDDPPPSITLMEGGSIVTYQWRAVDPQNRSHFYVTDQVAEPLSNYGGYIGAGGPDRDRLMCHTGSRSPYNLGDPIVYVASGEKRIGYGSTAGADFDRHDGCPLVTQYIYEHDANKWRPVSIAAGEDSDAFDHATYLIHSPQSVPVPGRDDLDSDFDYPVERVPVKIVDDDEWEQDLVFSIDDGSTWTSLQDGGLALAFPMSLNIGTGSDPSHKFWVRLEHDPTTLGGSASPTKRFSVTAFKDAPISSGTSEEFRKYYVHFKSPAASHLHTFRADTISQSGSVTVSYTPIQVEIYVGSMVTGNIRFEVEGYKLYERTDNQISTSTPKVPVRTQSFSFYRTVGSCVGCLRLLGGLPDPVVDRVGNLIATNLSEEGIDLSWPRVIGAEGYEVRWWSTTPLFEGLSAEEAWFGAEPNEPFWGIRYLEPDTEYRAVVYYADQGVTQMSSASPVIRFTTLSAGDPIEAEPTSPVFEHVPEVSIVAANGTITEGGEATFTVSADPAPDAPLDVNVYVVGPSAGNTVDRRDLGKRTVSVPTGGSAEFTIPTFNDAGWKSNGMLGAGVEFGEGYRRSKFDSYASVYIANNDAPPPPRVQLKSISDTAATIAWAPQDGVTQYHVGWYKTAGLPVTSSVDVSGTEYRIAGLAPKTRYAVYVLAGARNLGQLRVLTLASGQPEKSFQVDFATPPPDTTDPEVRITEAVGGTEGESVTFTVTAYPAPSANLTVSLSVLTAGDFGYGPLPSSVTIPVSGSASLSIATADDDVDETDGTVKLTLNAGDGYLVGAPSSETVSVVDDDETVEEQQGYTVDPDVVAKVKNLASQTQHGAAHVNRWNRVLVAFGEHDGTGVSGGAMTAAEARTMAERHSSPVWDLVVTELTALEAATTQTPPTPIVSVAGGAGVTEGGDAIFTVTANPTPASNLSVSVTVSQSGAYGASTGQRTVTVPSTGSVSLTVSTTDDSVDEPNGSVTATVNAGTGYAVSTTQGVATISIADNDDPPKPVVSISGSASVTEGGDATFTVTASPVPTANLSVSVTVSQSGDFGATTGQRSVTVPTTGSVSFTVSTTDDSVDEPNGSVTATVNAGSDYTVSSTEGVATVGIADNDEPPKPVVSISGGASVTEGGNATFTVTASPVPTANLSVSVTVSQSGDFGATTGQRTVTVPSAGSVSLTVSTTDDSVDEPNGSVTATVNAGSDYTVSSTQGVATVGIADNDDPPNPVVSISGGTSVTEGGNATFTVTASPVPTTNLSVSVTVSQSGDFGATAGQRSVTVPTTGSVSFTVSTTDDSADETDGSVTATVNAGNAYTVSSTQGVATVGIADNDDPPKPVVSISGGTSVTEGGNASFTVTASPAPASNLSVSLTVSQSGDFGATAGQRSVTVPTSGSVSLTVSTTDDSVDEPNGSVTATVNAGSDYTVSSTQGAATVGIADNDDPPKPVVSISGGAGVTEGGNASFTVTASPAPASNLSVSLTVSQSGDFGATAGQRTVTVPSTGSVSLTVSTTDDSTDETDGSVTVSVNAGNAYTVSSSQGVATVAVADDDESAPETEITVYVDDASAIEGEILEFRVWLSEAPAGEFTVRWESLPAHHISDNRARMNEYQATYGEMVFGPDVTELTGEVWLEQDTLEEPDEYFAIEAFLPGSYLKPDAVGTMTIIDDD